MSSAFTVRGWAWVVALVTAPFVALLVGDPSPALLVVPLAPVAVAGLLARPATGPAARSRLARGEIVEGETAEMEIEVEAGSGWARAGLALPPDSAVGVEPGVRVLPGPIIEWELGRRRILTIGFRPRRWGGYHVGVEWLEISGRVPIRTWEVATSPPERLVVLPGPARLRQLVAPIHTNLHVGDLSARDPGSGTELAHTRPWGPGDSPRAINWRATMRSDGWWVTDRHAERNGDIVVVLDPIGEPSGDIAPAVREAASLTGTLVRAYAETRHRVGLVDLAGGVSWFGLAGGLGHAHRLLAAVIESQMVTEPVWSAVDRVLARSLHPPALALFVTTLTDEAVVGRIRRLAKAGIDTAVVAVGPQPWMKVGASPVARLAQRIWALERDRLIDQLRAARVAVGVWEGGRSCEEALAEMEEWRRRRRRLRV